jgi:hypothetical protein
MTMITDQMIDAVGGAYKDGMVCDNVRKCPKNKTCITQFPKQYQVAIQCTIVHPISKKHMFKTVQTLDPGYVGGGHFGNRSSGC